MHVTHAPCQLGHLGTSIVRKEKQNCKSPFGETCYNDDMLTVNVLHMRQIVHQRATDSLAWLAFADACEEDGCADECLQLIADACRLLCRAIDSRGNGESGRCTATPTTENGDKKSWIDETGGSSFGFTRGGWIEPSLLHEWCRWAEAISGAARRLGREDDGMEDAVRKALAAAKTEAPSMAFAGIIHSCAGRISLWADEERKKLQS